MAIWPFTRRKSGRKRRQDSTERGREVEGSRRAPQRSFTEPSAMEPDTATRPPSGSKAQRGEPGKLRRRSRRYSFSPGRRDSLGVAQARQESIPPLPTGPILAATLNKHTNKELRPSAPDPGQGAISAMDNDIVDRVPTLHHNGSRNKRGGQHLPLKKSSKRRKEEHDRAAEIKAMSQPKPQTMRAATDNWTSGRPIRKEVKRSKTAFGRSREGPGSDVSLPFAESIHSAMSSDSEHVSWTVSALAALAPRPTLRYSSSSLKAYASAPNQTRPDAPKRKISEKKPVAEATLKAHKRIDDLADDLDASDIRELMERDKRRREAKKERERQRMERRLARRSERQREASDEAARNGTPPPQNLDRGVLGRDAVGLGIDTTSAVLTSSRRRPSGETPRQREKQPERAAPDNASDRSNPLENFHRPDSIAMDSAIPIQAPVTTEEAVPETRIEQQPSPPRSPSPKLMDIIRKSRSKSPKPIEQPTEAQLSTTELSTAPNAEASRITTKSDGSMSSTKRPERVPSRAWGTILRWTKSKRGKRGSGPSSFSNTSRDSMQASSQHLPPVPPQPPVNYVPMRKASAGVPKRTMSRFREDLPELPLSPPDSRVASPEAENQSSEPIPIPGSVATERYETPTSDHHARSSFGPRDDVQPSPAPLSMSLASVDSEASWLSGKMNSKRGSAGIRESLNSAARAGSDDQEGSAEGGIADEEQLEGIAVEEGLPSSDLEEDYRTPLSPKWGNVSHDRAQYHNRDTMKSREVLLQSFESDDEKDSSTRRNSDKGSLEQYEGETPLPQSATSVDFRHGHARNFSAGSAKLLDILPSPTSDRPKSTGPITQ